MYRFPLSPLTAVITLVPLLLAGCVVPGVPYDGTVPYGVVAPVGPPAPIYYNAAPSVVIAPTNYPGYGYGYWYANRFCGYRNGYYFRNGSYYRGGNYYREGYVHYRNGSCYR